MTQSLVASAMMNSDYQRIERAINYLRENADKQPSLDELARAAALSPYHFQKLFRRWAGVSPKQFLKYLTVTHARELIEASMPTLDTSFAVGLSGPGRLHDHFVTVEAVTPGELRHRGKGLEITYGQTESPFGRAFAAMTDRGICRLEFIGGEGLQAAIQRLSAAWPRATIKRNVKSVSDRIGRLLKQDASNGEIRLLVQGTNFQIQVWQALLRIPPGNICSYGQLAKYIGRPDATRAVATAIGANAIAYLIPCHRVLRAGGELGGYRWGLGRKQAMLAREFADVHKSKPDPSRLAMPA